MTATNRRTWLRVSLGAVARVGAFAAGLTVSHLLLRGRHRPAGVAGAGNAVQRTLVRPPGALPEPEFLAACIRCYLCQDVCGPGAIQFYAEEDGHLYHTPYVDPSLRACTLCMRCTQACPTPALAPLTLGQKSEVDMASVTLSKDLCLSYKARRIRDEQAMMMALGMEPTESDAPVERRGPCGECYMFCPLRQKAILLEPGAFLAPIVVEEECVGCGMCEEICRVILKGEPAIRVVPTRRVV